MNRNCLKWTNNFCVFILIKPMRFLNLGELILFWVPWGVFKTIVRQKVQKSAKTPQTTPKSCIGFTKEFSKPVANLFWCFVRTPPWFVNRNSQNKINVANERTWIFPLLNITCHASLLLRLVTARTTFTKQIYTANQSEL